MAVDVQVKIPQGGLVQVRLKPSASQTRTDGCVEWNHRLALQTYSHLEPPPHTQSLPPSITKAFQNAALMPITQMKRARSLYAPGSLLIQPEHPSHSMYHSPNRAEHHLDDAHYSPNAPQQSNDCILDAREPQSSHPSDWPTASSS